MGYAGALEILGVRISWRGLSVFSAALAMVLLFAGYRQQMRLVVLALRGEHANAEIVECRNFGLGLRRIRYQLGGSLLEATGETWSLRTAGRMVPVTYVWAICSYHGESFSVVGDARWRVWELPLQIALFLGLST